MTDAHQAKYDALHRPADQTAWDASVKVLEANVRPSRPMSPEGSLLPPVFLWRGSVSRPWQLERNSPSIAERIHYDGPLFTVLFESVLVTEHSAACIDHGLNSGFFDRVVVIRPQRGHGYALDYAIRQQVKTPYFLKWEDDFAVDRDIDLTACIRVMEANSGINQIAFNKRPNEAKRKVVPLRGKPWYYWHPNERRVARADGFFHKLTTRDKWWFGPALWRMSFVKPIWKFFKDNVHNYFNSKVVLPLIPNYAAYDERGHAPDADELDKHVGAYWWGAIKAPRYSEHTGRGDSIWAGEYQIKSAKRGWKLEGV